jgi:hypothetical protein
MGVPLAVTFATSLKKQGVPPGRWDDDGRLFCLDHFVSGKPQAFGALNA